MKKVIIALFLAVATLFSGCSCSSLPALSFSNNWSGGQSEEGAVENAVYTLSFNEDFRSSDDYIFDVEDGVKQCIKDIEYTGTYKTSLKVIQQADIDIGSEESDLLIVEPGQPRPSVIEQTTEFDLNAVYTLIDNQTQTFNDKIYTKSYFFKTDASLSPIYSEKTYNCTLVSLSVKNNNLSVSFDNEKYACKFIYNKHSYTIKDYDYDAFVLDPTVQAKAVRTIGYSYRTVVDNTELLFSLRNLSIEKDKTKNVPVADFTYGNYQTLIVKNYLKKDEICNVKINGLTENLEVPVNCLSFGINASNTGRRQLVFVQNGAVGSLKNNAFIIKYVQPLTTYGSYTQMGALEYTLSEINYNK